MKRETLGTISFVLLIGVTVIATYGAVVRIAKPKSQLEEKYENADLVRYYLVERESGPTFELRKNDQVIKLITHLELPGYEKNARILYGFNLQIQNPSGQTYWETDVYTRTRQSKDDLVDGVYRQENAFDATSDTEYGDDRLLEIRLPNGIADGSRLAIRLLGDAAQESAPAERALLRAYRLRRRSAVARQIREISMSRAEKRKYADRIGLPWDLIPKDQRDALISYRWERMAAMGEEGSDFDTRLVFYTGFRTRSEEDEDKGGIHVHASHHAAINVLVREPTELTLMATSYIPGTPPRCVPGSHDDTLPRSHDESLPVVLEIDFVSGDGTTTTRIPMPDRGHGYDQPLAVAAGLHSLHFRTDSPSGVVFCLRADPTQRAQFGFIQPIPIDASTEELIADVRQLPAYYSDSRQDQEPISTYIDGPFDVQARTFIIEARALMSEHEWTGDKPQLSYRFLDDKGNVTARGYTALEPVFAPFEKARLSASNTRHVAADADDAATDDDHVEGTDGDMPDDTEDDADDDAGDAQAAANTTDETLLSISQPMRFPLIAPISARHLEVWTDRPSLIRVLGNLGDRDRYEEPYCNHAPEDDLRWRYAPREQRRWFPTRPENRDLLADTDRIVRVRVQVRLEHRAPERYPSDQRVAVLLEPVRPPERQLILEPVAEDSIARLIQEWPPGMYTKLQSNTRISVRPGINKRPKLRYLINGGGADLLGLSVDVETRRGKDASIALTRLLSTPRGAWTLPYLPKGESIVRCLPSTKNQETEQARIDALRNRLDCYINLPPSGGQNSRIVRARTVYPLDHRPLRLIVDKKPGRDIVVNAVVYDGRLDGRTGPYINARIDGGQPRRTVGVVVSSITRAERWWPLPPANSTARPIFVDLADRTPGFPRTISMRLGGDLAVGKHVIELEAPPLAAWVRFYTYDIRPRERESVWQWQFEAPERSAAERGGSR